MVFDIIEHLQIRPELKESILEFRKQYPMEPQFQSRIPVPSNIYYGTDIWEKAVTALLCGKNILLVGHKATGKNIFAENLAAAFARPRWDVSFHVNMDAASLIGMDTFKKQEVIFRPGPICCAAQHGGFAVLDEINMAKSEALAVLHGTLDFRRSIDVPGYERIDLHPATRFIATYECDASQGFKDVLLQARDEDLTIIHSPVGMPGRAVRTPLIQRLEQGVRVPPKHCSLCMAGCQPAEVPFCITHALIQAVKGNREEGLFFSGSNVGKLDRMLHVRELMDELMKDWRAFA